MNSEHSTGKKILNVITTISNLESESEKEQKSLSKSEPELQEEREREREREKEKEKEESKVISREPNKKREENGIDFNKCQKLSELHTLLSDIPSPLTLQNTNKLNQLNQQNKHYHHQHPHQQQQLLLLEQNRQYLLNQQHSPTPAGENNQFTQINNYVSPLQCEQLKQSKQFAIDKHSPCRNKKQVFGNKNEEISDWICLDSECEETQKKEKHVRFCSRIENEDSLDSDQRERLLHNLKYHDDTIFDNMNIFKELDATPITYETYFGKNTIPSHLQKNAPNLPREPASSPSEEVEICFEERALGFDSNYDTDSDDNFVPKGKFANLNNSLTKKIKEKQEDKKKKRDQERELMKKHRENLKGPSLSLKNEVRVQEKEEKLESDLSSVKFEDAEVKPEKKAGSAAGKKIRINKISDNRIKEFWLPNISNISAVSEDKNSVSKNPSSPFLSPSPMKSKIPASHNNRPIFKPMINIIPIVKNQNQNRETFGQYSDRAIPLFNYCSEITEFSPPSQKPSHNPSMNQINVSQKKNTKSNSFESFSFDITPISKDKNNIDNLSLSLPSDQKDNFLLQNPQHQIQNENISSSLISHPILQEENFHLEEESEEAKFAQADQEALENVKKPNFDSYLKDNFASNSKQIEGEKDKKIIQAVKGIGNTPNSNMNNMNMNMNVTKNTNTTGNNNNCNINTLIINSNSFNSGNSISQPKSIESINNSISISIDNNNISVTGNPNSNNIQISAQNFNLPIDSNNHGLPDIFNEASTIIKNSNATLTNFDDEISYTLSNSFLTYESFKNEV